MSSNELNTIIERIASGTQTATDVEALRVVLSDRNQDLLQLGKYNVNIGRGQDIHIGDRTYVTWNDEAIQALIEVVQKLQSTAHTPTPQLASVDELVQQVRSRLHDDIQCLHGTMPLWGVDRWVPLGELFVDVNILEELSSSRKSELDDLWQDFTTGIQGYASYRSLDRIGLGKERQRVSGLEALAKNTNLMVVGKPGSGKTTYLQRVVTECNALNLQAHRIPVLIKLREFVDDGREVAYSLERYLEGCWRLSDAETQLVLDQGRVLMLLDGLDEVTGEDAKKIAKDIKRFARAYPQVQVIVTCRTQSQESRFERFDYVEVADFNEPQVRAFAQHWFKTVMGNESAGLARAREFLGLLFLEENKPIRELAITPILLSLTCAVFHQTGKFYSKRSKLYEEGLELLLEQWDKSRSIERDEVYRDLSVERKLELLSYLAVKKFEQEQYVLFEQAEIEGYIAEFLGIGQRDSRVVLRAIESQHGLLIERSQRIYSFSHLTFQEYLVAKWFCDLNRQNVLVEKISQLHWREIFLLNSEIMPDLDSLLTLIKISVNNLIGKDQKIQDFLNWVNQKSDSLETSYKSISLRAFYFETAFTLVIAPKKAHDAKLAHLNENGGLTLFLEGAFSLVLTRSCKDGIQKSGYGSSQLSLDYMLIYALVLSMAFSNESTSERQFYYQLFESLNDRLERAISSAQDLQTNQLILENINNSLNFINNHFWENWKAKTSTINNKNESLNMKIISQFIESWSKYLRSFMLEKRNIGHDWNFSDTQSEILREYYYANVTLMQCLNSDTKVSAKLRQEIEETMILPITKIEKRK